MLIEVLRPGALTTVQDLGRPGFAHLGVPCSGAADPRALERANALVGNDLWAAALETTLTGPALRFSAAALIALTGAPARARLGDRELPFDEAVAVKANGLLDLGQVSAGVRSYIAVAGGIAAQAVLGSRATDTLTGLGPPALARGDQLAVGERAGGGGRAGPDQGGDGCVGTTGRARAGSGAGTAMGTYAAADLAAPTLRVIPGPRDALFSPDALDVLVAEQFTVSPTSNRIGVRLTGPQLERSGGGELPSEGLVRGALQVPPSGDPMLMLADHPTTGGYPVIAVVIEADHGLAGQLRPGVTVRFALAAAR